MIISEDLTREFERVKAGKGRVSPKVFSKEHIVCNRRRYNNRTQFYRDYFSEDIEKLVSTIKTYRHLYGAHKKDEMYLADLK